MVKLYYTVGNSITKMAQVIGKSSRLNQYIGVVVCALPYYCYGLVVAWTSYTIPLLESVESPLMNKSLTTSQNSLLGSLPSMGAMVSTPAGGWIVGKFGRKQSSIFVGIPYSLAWIIILLAKDVTFIMIGRFISGLAAGVGLMLAPIYIGEISETSIRGAMSSSTVFFNVLGVLTSYTLGGFFSFKTIVIFKLTVAVMYTIAACVIPDSPVYLMEVGKVKKAIKAMAWYRGAREDSKIVIREIDEIRRQLIRKVAVQLEEIKADNLDLEMTKPEMEKINESEYTEASDSRLSSWQFLKSSRSSRKIFVINVVIFSLQTYMGMTAVMTYAGKIFNVAAPELSTHFCSVMFAVVMLAGVLTATFTADRAGRKLLLMVSCASVSACTAALGACLQTGAGPRALPPVLLCVCIYVFCVGAGTVPYVLFAEMFAPEIKTLAASIVIEVGWIHLFILLGAYAPLMELIGQHGIFYLFSGFSLALTLYTAIEVPETKGLDVDEIQALF